MGIIYTIGKGRVDAEPAVNVGSDDDVPLMYHRRDNMCPTQKLLYMARMTQDEYDELQRIYATLRRIADS